MPASPRCLDNTSEDTENNPLTSFRELFQKRCAGDRVVLVMADDDEDDCLLVGEALKQASSGCIFRCVRDGVEMMDYLNRSGDFRKPESSPVPDIILLDLNMPKMNGREVLKKLKTDLRFRSIPVIILTTSREIEDVRACYSLGANSFITKQPSFEGLVSAMKTLTEYWIEIAALPPRRTQTWNAVEQN